jgi:hypothetical protein
VGRRGYKDLLKSYWKSLIPVLSDQSAFVLEKKKRLLAGLLTLMLPDTCVVVLGALEVESPVRADGTGSVLAPGECSKR